jgi:hypothetical protein
MADQSRSTRFQVRFESALLAYQETTSVTLVEHPVAVRLLNCNSVDTLITILLYEARAFSDLPAFGRITKAIESTISILSTLPATAFLGYAIDLVRQKAPMAGSTILTIFLQPFPPAKAIQAGLAVLLAVCNFSFGQIRVPL